MLSHSTHSAIALIIWTLLCTYKAQVLCVNSDSIELCVDSNTSNNTFGVITSISTKQGLKLETIGYSWIGHSYFDDNNVLSINISSNANNAITITKSILYKHNNFDYTITVNDTFYVHSNDPSTIEWSLIINNISCNPHTINPFHTSIATQLNLTNIDTNDIYYWTIHSGAYYENHEGYKPFVNVLELLNGTDTINSTLYTQIGDKYVDESIWNNTPTAKTREISVFPLTMFVSKSLNHGISFIYDLTDDILLGATININSEHQLFQRYYNRLSTDMDMLTFKTYIRVHNGFNFRDTLNWTISKFDHLFKPFGSFSNKKVNNIVNDIGLGMYTCVSAQDMNVMNVVNNSGANMLWDAQFWFVYIGMYLPPVQTWNSYVGTGEETKCGAHFKHGELASRDIIKSHYYNMSQIGVTTLSYFNVFEFGDFQPMIWPLNITNINTTDIWKNASLYVSYYFNDSVVLDSNGNAIYVATDIKSGLIMDPAIDSFQQFILNQTYEHIYSFNDTFYGIGIDRLDWTSTYNYRYPNNYSLCGDAKSAYKECTALLLSYKNIAQKVSDIVHNEYTKNTAIIASNYQKQRMDLLMISDFIFTEQSNLMHLNSNGLSSLAMHCIEWTYDATEVLNSYGSAHDYFQLRLFLNIHSMAPVLGADHSIPPNQTVQNYYNEYGLLFRALRGVTWWLVPDTVQLLIDNPQNPIINSFISNVNNDIIIVTVLGFNLSPNVVDIKLNITGSKLVQKCETIYPGQVKWNNVVPIESKTVITVPSKYGCSVTRCSVQFV